MSQKNKDLMHNWFEQVWNKGDASAIDELLAENAVIHGLADPSGTPVTGREAFRDFHTQFRNAFPDIVIDVEDCIAEDDKVVARCNVKAKHSGPLMGFGPTDTDVDFTGIAIIRVSDGRIVEAWNNFDFLKMNRQLGVL
jgi:steroid delta-isomerase-like uncharacterized protein